MNPYMPSDRLLYQFIEAKSWTVNIDLYIFSSNWLHESVHIQSQTANIDSYTFSSNQLHRSYMSNHKLLYEFIIWKWKSIFEFYIIWKVFIMWDDTWLWSSDKCLDLLPVMTNSLITWNFMKRNSYSVWDKAADLILMHVILFFDISFRLCVLV